MRPRMEYACCRMYASGACRAWLISRSGQQPARAPARAIENIVDADPVAAHVRELMADRAQWTGSASDLLQVGINIGRLDPVWLAKESPRTRWPAASRTDPLRSCSAARGGRERGQSG